MQSESESISVPWTGFDVLLFLALWFGAQIACGIVAGVVFVITSHFSPSAPPQIQRVTITADSEEQPIVQQKDDEEKPFHLLIQLLKYAQREGTFIAFLVAFFFFFVAAPLIEEFLFRLLCQGWLEAKLSQYQIPGAGAIAVTVVSLFFALLHMRGRGVAFPGQVLLYLFAGTTVMNLLLFTLGIFYLMWIRNAKMPGCLLGTERFFHAHFFTAAGYCFLTLLFIYGVSYTLDIFFPRTAMDPIPIFIFSILLGTVYRRTRNLSYCVLLHAFLNGTSLLLARFTL
jgi:membrane protease YdiL (CAAX protease family)